MPLQKGYPAKMHFNFMCRGITLKDIEKRLFAMYNHLVYRTSNFTFEYSKSTKMRDSNDTLGKMKTSLAPLIGGGDELGSVLRLAAAIAVKNILSIEEAAFFLGYQPDYIYQLKYNGEIKALPKKKRGKLYFLKTDLEDYMTSKNVNVSAEDTDLEREILTKWNKKKA